MSSQDRLAQGSEKAGGLAFTAFTGIPTPDQIQTIVGTLEGFLANPAKLATKDNLEAAVEGVKGLLKSKGDGDSTNVPEEINAIPEGF
ncbi:hypothetical protein SAMN04488498_14817 [Mesorhizobium albiziae]|uniref:Uncharacterized protein n=1 Tax=Neomesorhizobium albiziae TaxID=335020 RepID=A0A1I4FK25_9HYPH|nr:hypothetical protein [Mesorhizobium albiziae]GLS32587.1 hypothetical protein GCM10007937_42970 [Mesorhizobium albiziae]SFL17823.1 hypothetical protein SAMN04488498_14817 [Mesorhizobium albiziae]